MGRLWLLLALLVPSPCRAQVTGTFSLEKTTFAPGEPVFLSLTIYNAGKEPQEVMAADPYTLCSGYKIHITRDANPQPACFQGYVGHCMSRVLSLAPGASHTERLLLNYRNNSEGNLSDPVGIAGDYTVDASREISYAAASKHAALYATPDHIEAHQVFHLRVDDALELSPTVYVPYVQQLDSKDDQIRREAARTLATFAPPALEPLLLTFATSKDYVLKQFAPLALANLSTKASLAALAQMLLDNNPDSYESMKAAEYLGKTHDPVWFPLLLEADQHGAMYLFYAAESGGDAAIPALLARLHTPDANARSAAIMALGNTGSRAAVPLLISLLNPEAKDEDGRNNSIAATSALRQLTHVYAEQDPNGTSIPNLRYRWQNWWLNYGPTATIYTPDACVADTKLP